MIRALTYLILSTACCSFGWAQGTITFGAPITACLTASVALDVQIAVCENALASDEINEIERAYLPPIIATLRGEVGDFDTAVATSRSMDKDGAEILLAMGDAQFAVERYELAMADLDISLNAESVENIAGLQRYLSRFGVFQDEIDGVYDSGTSEAIANCIRVPSCDLG